MRASSIAFSLRALTLVGTLTLVASPAFARCHAAPSATPTPNPTAAPTAAPTPVTHAARLQIMREQLATIARNAPGRLGIAVRDLATDERVAIRGDERFPLAGIQRIALGITAYRLADQKKFLLDERVVVRDRQHEASLTNWQLVRAMLVANDSTASDEVLRALGGPGSLEKLFERLRVRGLALRPSEAERRADARHASFGNGAENGGSPEAIADLLQGLALERFTLLDGATELLNDLSDVTAAPLRLRAGLPPALRLAHEAGSSETFAGMTAATNDAGLVTLPDGRRIVIVALLADSPADAATRDATLARVARAVADAYAP